MQKRFNPLTGNIVLKRLSAFSFTLSAFSLLLYTFIFTSCSHNPNYQTKGEAAFQGEWKQDTTAQQKLLVSYSLYDFKFTCDSFYLKINTVNKGNLAADSCSKGGHWTEYAKGNYEMHHDTLQLKGFFCLPNWKIKYEGGCFRYGVYEEGFKIIKKTDSAYQLLSTASVNPFNIRLTKRITCIPKPLY